MDGRIEGKQLIDRVCERTGRDRTQVAEVVEATLEGIYEALKREECVSLRNFGAVYIRRERNSCAFKFNPSQRLRKLFGWSSTYRGEL